MELPKSSTIHVIQPINIQDPSLKDNNIEEKNEGIQNKTITPITTENKTLNIETPKDFYKVTITITIEIIDIVDIPILNQILTDRYGSTFQSNTQCISYVVVRYSFAFVNR